MRLLPVTAYLVSLENRRLKREELRDVLRGAWCAAAEALLDDPEMGELAAEELAKATRSEVVQVIGTKFVLYRESHSKPKEKRIQLVKPSKKKANP